MRLSKARKEIVTSVMKDTIFDAADSVLERHGVGGMTMDRVAATAGMTAGSLYNYFRNKDELLQCVYARLVEPFIQLLEEVAATDLTAPQKLEKIIHQGLERSFQQRCFIRLLAESEQESYVRREVRPRVLQILTRIFEQGVREGSFRPHNPVHTARMFKGCYVGLFDMQAEGASEEAVREYVEVLVSVLRNEFSLPIDPSLVSA
jgi:AcrR family transcriptional regulator